MDCLLLDHNPDDKFHKTIRVDVFTKRCDLQLRSKCSYPRMRRVFYGSLGEINDFENE